MKRNMKGITEVGEMIAFIFLIVIGFIIGGMISYYGAFTNFLEIDIVEWEISYKTNYLPTTQQDMLLALLECTEGDHTVKELFHYAVAQDSGAIVIPGQTELVYIDDIINNKLGSWQTGSGNYIIVLKTDRELMVLGSNQDIDWKDKKTVQRISIDINTPFRKGVLEYYVI